MFDLVFFGFAFLFCLLIAFPVVMGVRGVARAFGNWGGHDPVLAWGTFVLGCVIFLLWGGGFARDISLAFLDVMQFLRWRFGA